MKIADLRRRGLGLKVQDWQVDCTNPPEVHSLAESLVTWARTILAGCRRPYGINNFDLTLSFRCDSDARVSRLAFDRLKPLDLYQEAFSERLARAITHEVASAKPACLRISAALFSWGEAAHLALPNRAS